jgi:5-(carboxyamino)imidazole ribonucleotide synthase
LSSYKITNYYRGEGRDYKYLYDSKTRDIRDIQKLKIGVLGGGQLGRMLAQEAVGWNLQLSFLDKSEDFPVPKVHPNFEIGDFTDYNSVLKFGSDKDILTIEIENVNTDALIQLEQQGVQVYPQPSVIQTIKDKGLQKEFYAEQGIATAPFFLVSGKEEILTKLEEGTLTYPFIQKTRTAGYDGKGVTVIKDEQQLSKLFEGPSVIEDLIDIDKELAIIVARNQSGQMTQLPLTEMVFDERGNLLDYLITPSAITEEQTAQCSQLATEIISKLNMVGILAVEFFLDKAGQIIVNEVAPRPHNSGHHTINAGPNSQYDLHLRTLLNMDLPHQTAHKGYALMCNIVGEPGHTGEAIYEGLDQVYALPQVYVHLYGKTITKPLRKMGHVNIIGDTRGEVLEKLQKVKSLLKVKASI